MRKLVIQALDRARAMGYGAVFLGGDPKLYGRFGFEPSYKYGINHVKGIGNRAYADGLSLIHISEPTRPY